MSFDWYLRQLLQQPIRFDAMSKANAVLETGLPKCLAEKSETVAVFAAEHSVLWVVAEFESPRFTQ